MTKLECDLCRRNSTTTKFVTDGQGEYMACEACRRKKFIADLEAMADGGVLHIGEVQVEKNGGAWLVKIPPGAAKLTSRAKYVPGIVRKLLV